MSETTPAYRANGHEKAAKQRPAPISISIEISAVGTVDDVAAAVLARLALCLRETGTITTDDIADLAAQVERELS